MCWRPSRVPSYAYLLGLYLGDGCMTKPLRTTQPVIACDATYPAIMDAAEEAILATGLSRHVVTCDALGIRWTQSNARNISVSHRHSVALLDEWIGAKA